MNEKKQTRAEYQKSLQKDIEAEKVPDYEPQTRRERQDTFKRDQRYDPDERSEEKSRALAKRLNIAIALFSVGIILVFLILFFIG